MEEETQTSSPGPWAEVEASCVCQNIRSAARVVTQIYDECLQSSGLRSTQFTLLVALAVAGTVPLTRLAEILVMDRTTLARNLKPLEGQGLLIIDAGSDRRIRMVRLSDHGRQVLDSALPLWRQAQEQVISSLGEELHHSLIQDLHATTRLAQR